MTKNSTTVMVVEDDTALNDAYHIILTHAGYTVLRAYDGKEALEVIKQQPSDPDIILLDLRMPVMDGVAFLKEFKPSEHPDSTIVVFSNYDAHHDIDEAYKLGIDRYVLKARAAPKDLLHLVEGIVSEKSAA